MDTEALLKLKELKEAGVISEAEYEAEKTKILKKKPKKNIGFIVGVVLVVSLCFSIIAANTGGTPKEMEEAKPAQTDAPKVPAAFSAEFPLSVSGKMYDNIIGVPELSVSFQNQTDKEISAIKLHLVPQDVYGEELSGIFITRELYTDNPVAPHATDTKTWQLLDSAIKSGDVFVYSVYFADGTEWGNKEAAVSDIKKYGHKLQVKY